MCARHQYQRAPSSTSSSSPATSGTRHPASDAGMAAGPHRHHHHHHHHHHHSDHTTNILLIEKRILLGMTVFTALGFILWIIAVSTDYWFTVNAPAPGAFLNASQTYFIRSNSGLWRICRTEFHNRSSGSPTHTTMCQYHQLFPTKQEVIQNPQIDRTILHYTRTETAFSIISLLLMIMGHGFSIYTFYEHRYMFKRLAGGVHFLTAATILVVVEVLINSVNYEARYLPERHPKGATWSYGFSFFLACISFISYITAGCTFIICSRKRKGDNAPSEMHALADEPHILGRV